MKCNRRKCLIIIGIITAGLFCTVWAADDQNSIQQQLKRLEQAAAQSKNTQQQTNNTDTDTNNNNTNTTDTTESASDNNAANNDSPPNAAAAAGNTNTSNNSSDANQLTANLRDQAFVGMTNSVLPLSPKQVKTLRSLFDESQKAAATYPGTPPRPTSTAVVVNLSPGATPPVIRLQKGYVTSLVFVDATGAPWPIQAYDIGDPKAFNVVWNKKSNVMLVQALSAYHNGNLAVMLKGNDTPVMVTLMPGQRAVDYRVELRVPGLGPDAQAQTHGLPSSASSVLLDVLNGIPPRGSKSVTISGCGMLQCQAWVLKNKLYLRTSMALLSPGWIAMMNSPDGTHAYELTKTPVLLVSEHGSMKKLTINGV